MQYDGQRCHRRLFNRAENQRRVQSQTQYVCRVKLINAFLQFNSDSSIKMMKKKSCTLYWTSWKKGQWLCDAPLDWILIFFRLIGARDSCELVASWHVRHTHSPTCHRRWDCGESGKIERKVEKPFDLKHAGPRPFAVKAKGLKETERRGGKKSKESQTNQ